MSVLNTASGRAITRETKLLSAQEQTKKHQDLFLVSRDWWQIDVKLKLIQPKTNLHPPSTTKNKMSSTNSSTMNIPSILAALTAIETRVAAMRSLISTEAKPVPAPATKGKKASAKQAPADADAPVKPKREINPKIAAMNDERKVIFAEMKGAWSAANPSFASMESAELKKAIAEGRVAKPPSFPDAIKEHSRRLRENDPEAEARHQTYLAKRAKKDAAAAAAPSTKPADPSTKPADTETVASDNTSDSKSKRGPKPGFKLSEEEKLKRAEKRKQNAAAKKIAGIPPLPPSPISDA